MRFCGFQANVKPAQNNQPHSNIAEIRMARRFLLRVGQEVEGEVVLFHLLKTVFQIRYC